MSSWGPAPRRRPGTGSKFPAAASSSRPRREWMNPGHCGRCLAPPRRLRGDRPINNMAHFVLPETQLCVLATRSQTLAWRGPEGVGELARSELARSKKGTPRPNDVTGKRFVEKQRGHKKSVGKKICGRVNLLRCSKRTCFPALSVLTHIFCLSDGCAWRTESR